MKPPSGECSKILSQDKIFDEKEALAWDEVYCLNNVNYDVTISGSGAEILVSGPESASSLYFSGNFKYFSDEPMTPTGWFFDSKWFSTKTSKKQSLAKRDIQTCVRNKQIYFFGDSTIRNIYLFFIKVLKFRDYGLDNRFAWSRGRDGSIKELNATFQYRSHGPPLNNPGPEDARPYMSDSFDAIQHGGEGTIVFFTIGYHFQFFDADVYLRRIRIIKQSVLSFLARLPGAKVVIKGLHYHSLQKWRRTPWLTYRFEVMLRHEFHNITNVFLIENWDFSVLFNNDDVHPHQRIFNVAIGLLLPFLC